MNGFVPALLAVLLAEFGPRALSYTAAPYREALGWMAAAMIFGAGAGGIVVASHMTVHAQTLMLGIALAFAGMGQIGRVRSASGFAGNLALFWRGGSALLAFAFAARFAGIATLLGSAGGLVAALLLSLAARANRWPLDALRRTGGVLLLASGAFCAVTGLRLA